MIDICCNGELILYCLFSIVTLFLPEFCLNLRISIVLPQSIISNFLKPISKEINELVA